MRRHRGARAGRAAAGVEINDVNGVMFEWCRSVDRAIDVDREARERYGERPVRL